MLNLRNRQRPLPTHAIAGRPAAVRPHGQLLAVASVLALSLLSVPAAAFHQGECHPNQQNCTPGGELIIGFNKPAEDLEWQLVKRAPRWVNAWRTYQNNSKPWVKETYDPRYVYPTSFQAEFYNQCQNKTDWDYYVNSMAALESQVSSYQYSVNGVVQVSAGDCFLQELTLPGQGIHDVKLEVFAPGASTPYLTRTKSVRVRDYLVVLFGDSAASGEGAPDLARGPQQEWGSWVDRRCHRSEWAAVPLAVQELESDPHSTVTFLNFACSGATIQHWEPGQGAGILDRYAGIEPTEAAATYGDNDPTFYLPAQVDQLDWALRTAWPSGYISNPRPVDLLLTTGGINDVRFAKLALTCVLLEDCHNQYTALFNPYSSSIPANPVKSIFNDLAARIPGAYSDLRDALEDRNIEVKKALVMQYPGAFESDNGSRCTTMLEDVLPPSSVWNLVLNPLIGPAVLTTTILGPFLEHELGVNFHAVISNALSGNLKWTANEINWMVEHAMPRLDEAVRDGAQEAGFTFVDGIQKAFAKHGYCAKDNWIRRADEASFVQGPWNIVSRPLNTPPIVNPAQSLGLGIHALTKGLMHPGPKGYLAWSKVLGPYMNELRNKAPVANADVYHVDTTINPVFNTGFGAGVLLNDSDPNGDPLRAIMVKEPNHGTATLSHDGHLTYTPKPGYVGTDSLYYEVTDGGKTSNKTKVTFAVNKPWIRYVPTVRIGLGRQAEVGGLAAPVAMSGPYQVNFPGPIPIDWEVLQPIHGRDAIIVYPPDNLRKRRLILPYTVTSLTQDQNSPDYGRTISGVIKLRVMRRLR